MTSIIDASVNCTAKASALRAAGIETVIRYYSRDTVNAAKRLGRTEAEALTRVGMRLGIVHEGRYGDRQENFNHATGIADALYVRSYGRLLGQPAGSTIYFGVDFDTTAAQLRDRIVPYFQGIADAIANPSGDPTYEVGVYGSGATCSAILDAGLARRAWLAQSSGWSGYTKFKKSERWAILQSMPEIIAGIECDPNVASVDQSIGDFKIDLNVADNTILGFPTMKVSARRGLNLRTGPGVEFGIIRLLPFDTMVNPLKEVGNWTMIDLYGDGASDGFVSGAFLRPGQQRSPTTDLKAVTGVFITMSRSTDAIYIPELVRQGSSSAGLKSARETAKAHLSQYPTNGCAVHLSALLQQSGIDAPMTWGAGKLAYLLQDRGWSRINIGEQVRGDVGVCFDNNPNPPGADHIYLVVDALDSDKMLVADNQRDTDAPHVRFATGKGKTPTEYFLRAIE